MKKLQAIVMLVAVLFMGMSQAYAQVPNSQSGASATTNAAAQGGVATLVNAPVSGDNNTNYAANSAIAPGLAVGLNTCMGSSSVGGSGKVISIAFGTTWHDDDCQALNYGRELWNQGYKAAGVGVLCDREVIRYAFAVSGGIPYMRKDGVVVYRACPMRKADWIAKGEPLLNPVTGLEYTPEELNPPVKIAVVPMKELTPDQAGILLTRLTPEQKTALHQEVRIEDTEARAKQLAANQTVEAPVVPKKKRTVKKPAAVNAPA